MSNYLGDFCASDLLGSAIDRTNRGLRLPADVVRGRNALLPPAPRDTLRAGDAWGGVTELSERDKTLVLVRDGEYVSTAWGGGFRRRQDDNRIVGGGGPIFGTNERDKLVRL